MTRFHSSDFVAKMTGVSSSINSATIGYPSIRRPDQILGSVHPAYSKFFNRHTIPIKMNSKFIMFEGNTTQFFAEFNHPVLDAITWVTAGAFVAKKTHRGHFQ